MTASWTDSLGEVNGARCPAAGSIVYPVVGLYQRDLYPRVAAVGPTRLGAIVTLALEAPNDPGRAYRAAMAFDYQPGMRLTARTIPLAPDVLTYLTFIAPGLFPGFSGLLDGGGDARASFRFPGSPELEGLNVFVAFVVLDATATDGVRGVSNAVRIQATQCASPAAILGPPLRRSARPGPCRLDPPGLRAHGKRGVNP